MTIPNLDLKRAIAVYYSCPEIGNTEIRALFKEKVGSTRLMNLKRAARAKAIENGCLVWDAKKVNTEAAFEAWGLSIGDIERRYNKLVKFGLV